MTQVRWSEGWAVSEVVLLSLTAKLGARAGRRFQAALSGLLVLGAVMALWSATRIEDEIVDHEIFWVSGLGVLAIVVTIRFPRGLWGWISHEYDLHFFPVQRRLLLPTDARADDRRH